MSAAITARQRNNSVSVISNDRTKSGLFKAHRVDNYPGLPMISGSELLEKLAAHAESSGVEIITGQVNTVLPVGDAFHLGYGTEIITATSVILATGVAQTSLFPGEEELLGLGVSYCATCDGMLFRGKRVCAVCLTPDSREEAEYLASIGCEVVLLETQDVKIIGDTRVTGVIADGEEIACDGVFVLRQTVAPHLLLSGIQTEGGYICASSTGETNIPGVFTAGDCVGAQFQVAKAVGQGQVAALSASEYVARQGRGAVCN